MSSCRMNFAARAVSTKPNAVRGQIRLTSRCDRRYSSAPKNTVSSATPSRRLGLAAPRRMMRPTSVALNLSTSPICFRPRLRKTTPTASSASASRRTVNTLVMSQILVTNQVHVVFLHQRTHSRADERVKFVPKFIERRMGVKLGIAGRQPRDQPGDVWLVHPTVLQQTKDSGGVPDSQRPQNGAGARREQPEDQRVSGSIQKTPGRQPPVQPEAVASETEMRDTPIPGAPHQYSEYDRVQMKVEMAVDVVEEKPGRAESVELRLDFPLELRPQCLAATKVAQAARYRVVAEIATGINQAGNGAGGQRRSSADHADVQPDAEPRILPRQLYRFVRRVAVHHQAGGGEDALAVRADDGLIDGM